METDQARGESGPTKNAIIACFVRLFAQNSKVIADVTTRDSMTFANA